MNSNLWQQVHHAADAGILAGGYPFAHNFWYVGNNSPRFAQRVDTIAAALLLMESGDVLMLGPQTFTEGDLVVPVGLDGITIMGQNPYGRSSISPSATASNGLNIKSNFVELINLDIAQGATGTYAVKAGFETTASLNGFRARGCKFEGNGIALHLHGMSDVVLDDVELCWSTRGLVFQSNSHGFCTQIFVQNSRFHDQLTNQIAEHTAAQQVNGLDVRDCVFENAEDGTAPTDYILLPNNGNTGCFSGNRFATATNATGVLTIGTGIKWMANATEAGWSTARPA